ncbi:bile acid:sodium symporter [Streptomyces varsoviensis]|uniref:bile acid:sodium symporter family protein n=1 Tax=Streptomyces varsoviensis TaxID=67373 RepID=UPI0033CBEFA1
MLPLIALSLCSWPDPGEAEGLVVGLMLVLAMPIAGGAASWGQNAGGNIPLVVAMVTGSTLLGPLTVPLGMHLGGQLVGPYGAGALDDTAKVDLIARTGAGTFALVSVVLPCLAGIAVRTLLGEAGTVRALPAVKAVNLVNVLLLCYLNAAGVLGQALAHPDPDLLTAALGLSGTVCCLTFACGRLLSRWTRCDQPDRISLTFATGMNNSRAAAVPAAGLVLQPPRGTPADLLLQPAPEDRGKRSGPATSPQTTTPHERAPGPGRSCLICRAPARRPLRALTEHDTDIPGPLPIRPGR